MIHRGVLSLWTRTPHFRLRRGPLLVQTLSISLAGQAFRETQFVTDCRGAELREIMGWQFSEVATPLESWPADGLEHIWALGKLVACALQDRPFVQFDGDVLLMKPLPEWFRRGRLVAQSPDIPHYYFGDDMAGGMRIAGLAPGLTAYNAGLIGGSDLPLVRAYAWTGLDLAEKFRGCDLNGTTTSMLIEQYQLGRFAQRVGVPVQCLLPGDLPSAQLHAHRAGYAHLTGNAKSAPEIVARAEKRLARDFPGAYARFLSAWQYLCNHWPAYASDTPATHSTGSPTNPFVW